MRLEVGQPKALLVTLRVALELETKETVAPALLLEMGDAVELGLERRLGLGESELEVDTVPVAKREGAGLPLALGDTLLLPTSETVGVLVEDCEADAQVDCDAVLPRLEVTVGQADCDCVLEVQGVVVALVDTVLVAQKKGEEVELQQGDPLPVVLRVFWGLLLKLCAPEEYGVVEMVAVLLELEKCDGVEIALKEIVEVGLGVALGQMLVPGELLPNKLALGELVAQLVSKPECEVVGKVEGVKVELLLEDEQKVPLPD